MSAVSHIEIGGKTLLQLVLCASSSVETAVRFTGGENRLS